MKQHIEPIEYLLSLTLFLLQGHLQYFLSLVILLQLQ